MYEERQSWLQEGESLDDLQNGFWIIQKNSGFRYGIDAVLLSDFVRVRTGENVLDLGTGTGIIPLLLAARHPKISISGLEIQEESADMAGRSVRGNHLEDRISIVQGDIREAAARFGAASFSVAVSNPPYMVGKHGLTNPDKRLAIARHEILCTLEDLVRETAAILKDRGRFYLIHRPFRLAEIIQVLAKYRLEPKRMRLVYPYVDREPNLVMIEALKGGKPRLCVDPPLIVYDRQGVYTEEILQIYGDGRDRYGKKAHDREGEKA